MVKIVSWLSIQKPQRIYKTPPELARSQDTRSDIQTEASMYKKQLHVNILSINNWKPNFKTAQKFKYLSKHLKKNV